MGASRIEVFEQMLAGDPANTMVLFGLAKEYEKSGDDAKLIETLERYLAAADDEGNAYGMLARAYERTKQTEKAQESYQRGIQAATAHGHPGMAEEYKSILESEYESHREAVKESSQA
jgi:predicted Zn-dependent protease